MTPDMFLRLCRAREQLRVTPERRIAVTELAKDWRRRPTDAAPGP